MLLASCVTFTGFLASGLAMANIGILESLTATIDMMPGETATRTITVFNNGDSPQRVRVRLLDRIPGGDPEYVEPGSITTSASQMVRPEVDEFIVADGENRRFSFTVTAPPDVDEPATYWTVLMFEPEGELEEDVPPAEGIQIRTRTRYAYSVLVHVGAPDVSGITIGDVARGDASGMDRDALLIDATLQVEGQRVALVRVQAQVFDRAVGDQIFSTPPATVRLYPGYEREVRFDLSDVPPGAYEVLLLAETENSDMYAVRLDLDVGGEP